MDSLSSLPVCGISLSFPLMSRYDESSPHSYIRAGWTHRAPQGQRQSEALPGVWGEWDKGSKVKISAALVLISLQLHFHSKGHKSPCLSPVQVPVSFPSSLSFRLVDNAVAVGTPAIIKYQLFLATSLFYRQCQAGSERNLNYIKLLPLQNAAYFLFIYLFYKLNNDSALMYQVLVEKFNLFTIVQIQNHKLWGLGYLDLLKGDTALHRSFTVQIIQNLC